MAAAAGVIVSILYLYDSAVKAVLQDCFRLSFNPVGTTLMLCHTSSGTLVDCNTVIIAYRQHRMPLLSTLSLVIAVCLLQLLSAVSRFFNPTGTTVSTFPAMQPSSRSVALILAACGAAKDPDVLLPLWTHLGLKHHAAPGRLPAKSILHALSEACLQCDLGQQYGSMTMQQLCSHRQASFATGSTQAVFGGAAGSDSLHQYDTAVPSGVSAAAVLNDDSTWSEALAELFQVIGRFAVPQHVQLHQYSYHNMDTSLSTLSTPSTSAASASAATTISSSSSSRLTQQPSHSRQQPLSESPSAEFNPLTDQVPLFVGPLLHVTAAVGLVRCARSVGDLDELLKSHLLSQQPVQPANHNRRTKAGDSGFQYS